MRKITLTFLLLLLAVLGFAQGNYYNAVINLTGQALYTGLHALIATNTYSSYDGAKTVMFQNIDNVNSTVTCIYTGRVYTISSTYNGSSDPNTEHTYAQSWFSSSESSIKKADIHHLFPSNSTVNSSRGNLPFDVVSNHSSADVYYTTTPWQSYRGDNFGGYTVFEPCNHSKGDIARALLYFNTRYNDPLTQQNVNMIPICVAWNTQDPPDAVEIARNQAIYEFLGNRNPFVDHPEFVNRIWGTVASDDPSAPEIGDLSITMAYPNPFQSSTTLSLKSKSALSADISIYNIKGQKVRSWQANVPRGASEISWDGHDNDGLQLPAGLYLLKAISGTSYSSARLLMQ
jgi:hypothetical protein